MDVPNILTAEHRAAGLTLSEDEDIVTLLMGAKVIARFGHSALIENICYTADQAVEWARSGVKFEKE